MRTRDPRCIHLALVALGVLIALGRTGHTAAPHGALDTGFDGDGRVTVDIEVFDVANAVVVQPDGKVIVAGGAYGLQGGDFAVARLNRDGSLDSTFAGDGTLSFNFATSVNATDEVAAVALQPDGKIVLVGKSGTTMGVARLLPTGAFDVTFDGDGRAIVSVGGTPTGIAIQRNGKIVVVGASSGGDFVVARLLSNGTMDTTFSGDGSPDGWRVVDFGGLDEGRAIALDDLSAGSPGSGSYGDARIVVAGSTYVDGSPSLTNVAIARLTPTGGLDTAFDGDGLRAVGFDEIASPGDFRNDAAAAVVLQTDGRILVGGASGLSTSDFCVMRLTSSGALDTTFSGDGRAVAGIGGGATGMVTLHDGRVVLGGKVADGQFGIAMFEPDGSRDSTFGNGGNLVTGFEGLQSSGGLARQPDGQLVLVGTTGSTFAVLRVGAAQPLDLTFGVDGRTRTDSSKNEEGRAMLVQPDGKVVVAGPYLADLPFFGVTRYKTNGELDPTFGGTSGAGAGVALGNFGATDVATAMARQIDGKLVVVGYTNADGGPGANNFAIVRLNDDGSLDHSFNLANVSGHGAGYLTVDFGHDDRATSVAIHTDGKIVVAGYTNSSGNPSTPPVMGSASDIALLRLNADGSLDSSFSGDGKLTIDVPGGSPSDPTSDVAAALALQTDGHIVVGGSTYSNAAGVFYDFVLARVTTAGLLDATFDGDGIATASIEFGSFDFLRALVMEPGGQIVAVGDSSYYVDAFGNGVSAVAVARFTSNGSLDSAFSGDGRQTFTFGSDEPRPLFNEYVDFPETARAVVLQPNGKIVVAGRSDAGSGSGATDFAVARLDPSGTLDTSFNDTGRLLIDFGGDDAANGVAIVPGSEAIVVAGTATNAAGDTDFALLRLPSNEAPPVLPTLSVSDASVVEEDSGPVNATFTVSLSSPVTFQVTADVATGNGSATAGSDYTPLPSTTLEFAPGATSKTVTVTVTGDSADEADEGFVLTILTASNATITDGVGEGTIQDDDLTLTITTPTSAQPPSTAINATVSFLSLAGTASNAGGEVTSVVWHNVATGRTGTAQGKTNWRIPEITLARGENVILVAANGTLGQSGTSLTVTQDSLVYYLAEGATGPFFDYDLLLMNPTNTPAPISITFLKADGTTVVDERTVDPTSRTTIRVDDLPGLGNTAVSAVVTSVEAVPLVVERTMEWDANGYGAHAGSSVVAPDTTWLFAEGSQGFFDTYVLLANANGVPANVTVTFLLEDGPPVVKTVTVGATSRFNVYAGSYPELVNKSFSIVVASSVPIIAERAMYFGQPLFNGGHESAGVNAPSTTWFLAEGATGPFFDTYVLIGNPNASPAKATVTFLTGTGQAVTKVTTIPGNARLTINVENEDPRLADAAVSTTVTANVPVIAERAMYWPGPASTWYEAHNSFGVTQLATKWGLAEGRSGGPHGYETYILLANPDPTEAAEVRVTFERTDGTTVMKTYTVNPTSRFNIAVNAMVPELAEQQYGAVVEVTNGIAVAVERAVYSNAAGVFWAAGTNATGVRVP